MKLDLKIRNLSHTPGWEDFVKEELGKLELETRIDAAQVVLERQPDAAPACQASVVLVVPGPDIHATARDHTIHAAWLKTRADLEHQIRERKSRPVARLKSTVKPRAPEPLKA